MRAPYQVLVIPYFKNTDGQYLYATFLCNEDVYWAPITGGGEDNETILQSAMREAFEESGIQPDETKYMKLDSLAMIPRDWIGDYPWSNDIFVVPEYCFAVKVDDMKITLSHEHSTVEWLPYDEAFKRYKFEANKMALWELNQRLIRK